MDLDLFRLDHGHASRHARHGQHSSKLGARVLDAGLIQLSSTLAIRKNQASRTGELGFDGNGAGRRGTVRKAQPRPVVNECPRYVAHKNTTEKYLAI